MSRIQNIQVSNPQQRPSMRKRRGFAPSALVLALSSALAMPGTVLADDWAGNVNTNIDWFTPANWGSGAVPMAGTDVFINTTETIPHISGGASAVANNVVVGDSANGALNIVSGAALGSSTGVIGNLGGSNGEVNVGGMFNGVGASWTNTGTLTVGADGAGLLSILLGGAVNNTAGIIGSSASSSGAVSVDGMGSTWISTGDLTVGDGGTGTLAITAGGMVQNALAVVGNAAGSTGTVTVDNAFWDNGAAVGVGFDGTGQVHILNNGVVSSTAAVIGISAGGTGAVTVNGGGSIWDTGQFVLGAAGKGSLAITAGGTVADAEGLVGFQAGSTGTATVDGAGSKWTNNNDLTIGVSGTGTLAITNAGAVSNVVATIGQAAGSRGTVTVDGAGSTWTNTGDLIVGEFGTGSLRISGGGLVSNDYAKLGAEVDASGSVVVDGATWVNQNSLFVGLAGTGTLSISNGGSVTNKLGVIAASASSTGAVTVEAGSSWTNSSNLIVGFGGIASLRVSSAGLVSSVGAVIGKESVSTGIATVEGVGSTWTNSGDFFVGDRGAGTLNIANGGIVVTDGAIVIGDEANSVGILNIGGAAGLTATAPGVLVSPVGVQFGAGTGALNFNHTDNSANYVFDAPISGAGTLNQNAGWTQLTADSSGFTGLTNVNGGRLAVNGSLANSLVNVNSGGTLGGNGFVGGIQANAGGILAPGNSIGTLSVMGNVAQAAGSIYEVELNAAGQSDLIHATGTATIESGAVLRPIRLGAAPLTVGAHYTVLQADGGISGMYSLQSNPFMVFAASYDATHAYLDLTQVKTFAEVGLTPNQKAAGAGAERLGSGNLVYEAVLLSPTETTAQTAFDQLSGEVHASARSVILEDSRFVRDASLERLRAMDSERVANDGGAETAEDGKTTRLLPSMRDLAYWGRAMGSWGHVKGDGNAATVKRDTSGFVMGADTRFGEEGRFGVMGGYSRSAFDVSERNSSGSSENYHLGAYAGSRWGELALRTGINYSWHDVSTHRAVAFAGFSDSLKADYKAATTQAFAELGYRIKTERAELEPFVNLAHVNVSNDGFTERGGAAALASSGNNSGVTFSTLGLRASTNFSMDNGASVTARGSVGWRHASGDTTPAATLAFAGGSSFAIAGAPIAKSAAVVEAGLDFRLTNAATLGLSYGGQFGSGLKDHSARIHLNVAF